MLHVEASTIIHAPWTEVARLYRCYQDWPRLFPSTIRAVRMVRSEHGRTELEIHHRDGMVPNVMTEVSPNRVDLWERKRRYEGRFQNRFAATPDGTLYTVTADIRMKGIAKLLEPLLAGYARRQLTELLLAPVRAAAEASSRSPH